MGLPVDGICGAETLLTLRRLQIPHLTGNLVSAVPPREHLRATAGGLEAARVGIGEHERCDTARSPTDGVWPRQEPR